MGKFFRAFRGPFMGLAGLGLMLTSVTASAADEGWYGSLVGGVGWLGETSFSRALDQEGRLEFDAGFNAGAAIGYDLGYWRVEGEYLYQTNDTKTIRFTGSSGGSLAGSSGGDFSAVVIGGRALREFNLFGSERAVSYAGVGVAWLQEVDIDFETNAGEISFSADQFGYQLFAGVEYRITDRWTSRLELRYLNAGEVELEMEGAGQNKIQAKYERTSILFSVGYRL